MKLYVITTLVEKFTFKGEQIYGTDDTMTFIDEDGGLYVFGKKHIVCVKEFPVKNSKCENGCSSCKCGNQTACKTE